MINYADARNAFEAAFVTDMAKLLDISDAKRVKIVSIKAGSIIVDFLVLADSRGYAISSTKVFLTFKNKGVSIAGTQTESKVQTSAASWMRNDNNFVFYIIV